MHARGQKFRTILGAELDDLIQDLRDAEELYATRYRKGDVSGYVLAENTAVLEHEIAGVSAVRTALRECTIPADTEPSSMCVWFSDLARDLVQSKGYPAGILTFLTRKCAKVVRYVYEE